MAIEIPTKEELKQSGKADVRSELTGSNPFLKNSWLGAMVIALALLIDGFYTQLTESIKQFFWDTSELPYLRQWTAIFKVTELPATQATGNVVAEGVAGSAIAIGSNLSISGIQYTTTISGSILNQILSITSLTRSGGIVTVTFPSNHNLASGVSAIIAGAVEADYNGTFILTITGLAMATYEIETTPTSPATGTITTEVNTALIALQAATDFFGLQTNQDAGAGLTFVTAIPGVNNVAYVDFNGLTGGANQETTEANRIRFLDRVQNPVANFNTSAIDQQARKIAGNTRIFVNESFPVNGKVTIYFTRDNDGIIPTPSDVTRTKEKIDEIKPGHTDTAAVIVAAPTPKTIDFVLSSLDPNTSTMLDAVNLNLDVFFEEKTEPGRDLTENEYVSAIQSTIDTITGEFLKSFTLSSPTGDQSVAAGEIPVKGTVTPP